MHRPKELVPHGQHLRGNLDVGQLLECRNRLHGAQGTRAHGQVRTEQVVVLSVSEALAVGAKRVELAGRKTRQVVLLETAPSFELGLDLGLKHGGRRSGLDGGSGEYRRRRSYAFMCELLAC